MEVTFHGVPQTKISQIMNYVYIRFSTDRQDERQQMNDIINYLSPKGLKVDKIFKDEGVSGGKSYKDRKLAALVAEMTKGDCLIVSEISRLGRSMSDLNKLVNDELKPRGIRLIVIKMGLDLDCANIKAIDEMILNSFAFAAQLERELVKDRTRSALEARKRQGIEIGGTNRLWGSKTGADRKKALCVLHEQAAKAAKDRKRNNPNNKAFRDFIEDWRAIHGDSDIDWDAAVEKLNARGLKTATGMDFTPKRARAMYTKLLDL